MKLRLLLATLAALAAARSPGAEPVSEPTPVTVAWDFVVSEGWHEIDKSFSGETNICGRSWLFSDCRVFPQGDPVEGDSGYVSLDKPASSRAVAPAFRGVVTNVTAIFRPQSVSSTKPREATLLASLDGGHTFSYVTNYALPKRQNYENAVVFDPPLDGGDFGVIFCASNSGAGTIQFRRLAIEGTSTSPEEPGAHDWSPFGSAADAQPRGALSGVVLFLDPGFGYAADAATNAWVTGRPLDRGVVEDFGNLDQMNLFALQAWKAGATVVPMRPLGYQTNEVVIDNADTRASLASCVVFGGAWADARDAPCYGRAGDVGYRWTYACPTGTTAWASYRPDIPVAGEYPVYAWAGAGSNRVDQLYRVRHAGGFTEVRVDHRQVGNGWVWLGNYRFEAGAGGYVTVANHAPGAAEGGVVVADAVRFGNGMGDISRGAAGLSGLERELEAARYWIERQACDSQGLPADLYDRDGPDRNDDASAPLRMAEQMCRTDGWPRWRRLFLSLRSDAVAAVGAGAFDRLALHDPSADAETLTSLRGREALARDALRAVVRHLAGRPGSAVPRAFAPDAPDVVAATNSGLGRLTVFWKMPAEKLSPAHTGFVVYASTDGYGFGHPVEIASDDDEGSRTFADLPCDTPYFFRVCAVNAGGESLPSPVAGANLSDDGSAANVLVVDGFRRADAGITPVRRYDRVAGESGPVDVALVRPRMINSFDYVKEHGGAIAAAGKSFDSMDSTLVTARDLARHPKVVWFLGTESVADETLSYEEQQLLATFLSNHGALFVSGTDIGRDLDLMGSPADKAFATNWLHFSYVSDAVATNIVVGKSGTYFNNFSVAFNHTDAPDDAYAARSPEVLAPARDTEAFTAANYGTASSGNAAIVACSNGICRTVVAGFPFETVTDAAQRNRLMKKVVNFFEEDHISPTWIGDTAYTIGLGGQVAIDLKTQVTGYPSPAVALTGSVDGRTGEAIARSAYVIAEDDFIFLADPDAGIGEGTYTFTFLASNGTGGDVYQDVIITVGNSPIWQKIPDILVDLGEEAVVNLYRYVSGDPIPDIVPDPDRTDATPGTYAFDANEGFLVLSPRAEPAVDRFGFVAANAYGSDSVAFNVLFRVIDTDGDGIPDRWAKQYFGSPTGCNANLDPDGDRLSNWEEYSAGTDPLDRYSRTTPAYLDGAEETVRRNWVDWAIDWNAGLDDALESRFLLDVDPATEIAPTQALLRVSDLSATPGGVRLELASDITNLFQHAGREGSSYLGNGIAVVETASDPASLTNDPANLRAVPATIQSGRALIDLEIPDGQDSGFYRPSIRTAAPEEP